MAELVHEYIPNYVLKPAKPLRLVYGLVAVA